MKGTLTPAIAAPPPAMDYAVDPEADPVLRLSAAPTRPISGRCCAPAPSAAARIKDPAARDFALWYKYRNSPATSEMPRPSRTFRLAHPDWPGQDELREKAETALFLDRRDPDEVKAFFSASAPQTGAGKAALAGVYMKENNEAGRSDSSSRPGATISSMPRSRRRSSTATAACLPPSITGRASTGCSIRTITAATEAALRVSKLLPADEQKKVDGPHRRGASAAAMPASCSMRCRRTRSRPMSACASIASSGCAAPRTRTAGNKPGRCCSMRRASPTSCSISTIGGPSGASIAAAR